LSIFLGSTLGRILSLPPASHELDFEIFDDMIYILTHDFFVLDLSLFLVYDEAQRQVSRNVVGLAPLVV
jgi:hypothetical protein